MRLYTLLIGFSVLFVGCSSVKVLGDYSSHFSKKQIKVIKKHSDSTINFTELVIVAIVVDDSLKVGLYSYKKYKSLQSVQVVFKVLKYNDSISFPSGNKEKDEIELEIFEERFSHLFTVSQLEQIRFSFLRGAEISGRTL